jgi:hypothetical protein
MMTARQLVGDAGILEVNRRRFGNANPWQATGSDVQCAPGGLSAGHAVRRASVGERRAARSDG